MTCADKLRERIAIIEAESNFGRTERVEAAEPAIRVLPEIAAVIEAAEKVAWNPDEKAGGIVATPTYHLIQVHQALAALSARLDGAS